MGLQTELGGTMTFKEQEEEKEPTKKTKSQQVETKECGVTEVQGEEGLNWAKC